MGEANLSLERLDHAVRPTTRRPDAAAALAVLGTFQAVGPDTPDPDVDTSPRPAVVDRRSNTSWARLDRKTTDAVIRLGWG
jgi:hypothetical protein